jgi:hypothetical protein
MVRLRALLKLTGQILDQRAWVIAQNMARDRVTAIIIEDRYFHSPSIRWLAAVSLSFRDADGRLSEVIH